MIPSSAPPARSLPRLDARLLRDASLDELLDDVSKRYSVRFETLKIGEHALELLQITNMETLIDRIFYEAPEAEKIDLPFWARVWPTSILLAYFLRNLPQMRADRPLRVLEIGGGVGVCGLFAARYGLRTTITDYHPDALLFTRINILKNGLQDLAEVRPADFTADRLGGTWDYVIGSEVLYMEKSYRPLSKFLLAHLAPEGLVLLAKSHQRKTSRFQRLAQEEFLVEEKTIGYKGADDRHLSTIYKLKARKDVRA